MKEIDLQETVKNLQLAQFFFINLNSKQVFQYCIDNKKFSKEVIDITSFFVYIILIIFYSN